MVRLRGLTWDHPRGYRPLEALSHPAAHGLDLEIAWDRRSLKDFGDRPIQAMAQEYDLMIVDHPHIGEAATNGSLVAMDDHLGAGVLATLAEQSAGPSHASYAYAGRQWALAIDAAVQGVAYRPDRLTVLPRSWAEVMALAEDKAGRRVGLALSTPTVCTCVFLSMWANLGGEPFADWSVGEAALERLRRLAELAHPLSFSLGTIGVLDHMAKGEDIVYSPALFGYVNYASEGFRAHRLRFADLPGGGRGLLGGTGFAVSVNCPHPALACAYGAWLASAEVQRGPYVANGGQPGNVVAWRDAAADRLAGGFLRDLLEAVEHSYLRPTVPGFAGFQVEAGGWIRRHLLGEVTGGACLASVRAGFERLRSRALV